MSATEAFALSSTAHHNLDNQSYVDEWNDTSLEETFPDRIQFIQAKKASRSKKRKRLNITITSNKNIAPSVGGKEEHTIETDALKQRPWSHNDILESNDIDDFFSETHEEQDMACMELAQNRKNKLQAHDLAQLEKQKNETKLKLISKLQHRWKNEIKSIQLQVEGLNKVNKDKYENALQNLIEFQSNLVRNLETNRLEEHKMVSKTANENNEQIHAKYKQWSEQNRADLMPQLVKMRDQEILENNKNEKLAKAKIDARAAQLMAEADKEHNKKLLVLQNHQAHNKSEMEKFTSKTLKKRQFLHEYIVQNVMNSHKEKYLKLKQEILGDKNSQKNEEAPKSNENEAFEEDECTRRQTRRKNILSKVYIPTYITVDIHNEGLDVICLKGSVSTNSSFNPKETRKFSTEFIPWGYIARTFLYSIMCGEVPDHKIIDHKSLFSNGLQGLVKCIVTDKRVSAGDASDQRLHAMSSQSSRDTEQAAAEMNEKLSNCVNDETQAIDDMKRSSMVLETLKRKVAPLEKEYFNDNLDENRKKQMLGYISKLNESIANAERDILFKTERLAFIRKQRIDIAEAIKKILAENHYGNKINAKRESMQEYHGSDILCNFLMCFNQIVGKGLRSNHSSTDSSKRIVIVLRCPRFPKEEAEYAIDHYNSTRDVQSQIEKNRSSLIRTEELLLLSLHPHSDEQLPSCPPISSSSKSYEATWAEPGRYLDLKVPTHCYKSSSLLRSEPDHCVFNQHLSEMCSSSGRQFAALVSSHQMRALQDDVNITNDSDPFSLSEDKLKESYEFFMPPLVSRSKSLNATKSKRSTKKKNSDHKKATKTEKHESEERK